MRQDVAPVTFPDYLTEEVGARLYAVAAEFGRLAGWLAFETNQHELAQRYFLAALRAAHVSGDRAVGANVLAYMSVQAAFSDSPRDAVMLAESALNGARELTPAVEASLHDRLARGPPTPVTPRPGSVPRIVPSICSRGRCPRTRTTNG